MHPCQQVAIVQRAFCVFQNKPTIDFYRCTGIAYATQLSRAETRCPSFHRTCAGLQSSLIDFPLQCHRGGLYKHTFCDVLPHRARYSKPITSNTEEKMRTYSTTVCGGAKTTVSSDTRRFEVILFK